MSVKDIITVPNDILKKISEPIVNVGINEKKLINDLFETMYNSNGIGLAAVQVGILKRVVVIDVSSKDEKKNPMSFINPVIKNLSDETSVYEEGCLSIPETFIEIERPKVCEVEYIDLDGKKKMIKCEGLLSTCLQHEINHLDGKLIIDHLSKFYGYTNVFCTNFKIFVSKWISN
jgi:peptide deformylase